jgi:large subunit ribosomal protein L13
MKTFVAENIENSLREWILIDAADKPLGRLAVTIANSLRGKDKVTFTPQVDTGAFVVVINADKVKLTGRKEQQKIYSRFTGYRSGLKEMTAAALRARHPEQLVQLAVRGMLPRNHQSRTMFKRLKVYAGKDHPHAAQKPAGGK